MAETPGYAPGVVTRPLLLVLGLSLALGLPAAARDESPEFPDDFETGLEAARAFATQFGLVEEDSLLQRVNDIGYRVASQTGRDDILFNFHILDVGDPNAFALPGGFLFITRGMLETEISDLALAHLMGHELAHVTQRHFARADRTGSLLSLLQTAAVVATILAIPSQSSHDPVLDSERRVDWGANAGSGAITNTMIFSSVFRELLVRGYGRGLEMEADEVGRRLAVRAGYPMAGGTELLEHLHSRIFEDQEYGYWRTHPFFIDRLAKAKAAEAGTREPPPQAEVEEYRLHISERLAGLARKLEADFARHGDQMEGDGPSRRRPDGAPPPPGGDPGPDGPGPESTVLFLYRAALEANPHTASSLQIEAQLLSRRAEWERRKPEILRCYGPLLSDYDSLLVRIEQEETQRPAVIPASVSSDGREGLDAFARRVRSDRDEVARELAALHAPSAAVVAQPGAGLGFLQLFLRNFPDDSTAVPLRLRLAEQYRLADRPDEAAMLLSEPSESSEEADGTLALVLPQVKELVTLETVKRRRGSDPVAARAGEELGLRAAELDSLEIGSRYLERFPEGNVAPQVRTKVEELALQRYYGGRLHESLETYQEALDAYHRVILLAPHTEAARLAREGIERVHRLAGK